MQKKQTYRVVGLMSGTSLDGLDIALCDFVLENGKWSYSIVKAKTYAYDDVWRARLANASKVSSNDLLLLHRHYGRFLGKRVKAFLKQYRLKADFVSSHGHTIFHQPEKGLTFQLGSGFELSQACGLKVVADFRSLDVALGGQGAPLVPLGDALLFPEYQYCLNLGGFSNISFQRGKKRLAFDVCPVNVVLNALCPPYDENGKNGRSGRLNTALFHELNALDYYKQKFPKSLGIEWVNQFFNPVLDRFNIPLTDKLNSVYEHIAFQIQQAIHRKNPALKILVSGGGCRNLFLIERIQYRVKQNVIIAENELIDYKEALIFAFLGVLKIRNEVNVLSSVTGALCDSVSGLIFNPVL